MRREYKFPFPYRCARLGVAEVGMMAMARCIPAKKAAVAAIASFFILFGTHNANYAQSASFTQGKKEQIIRKKSATPLHELQRAKDFIEKAKISHARGCGEGKAFLDNGGSRGVFGATASGKGMRETADFHGCTVEANEFLDSASASLQRYEREAQKNGNGGKNMLVAFIAGAVVSLVVYFSIKLGIMHARENK